MVRPAGIEPATFGFEVRHARVRPMTTCRAPRRYITDLQRGPPRPDRTGAAWLWCRTGTKTGTVASGQASGH